MSTLRSFALISVATAVACGGSSGFTSGGGDDSVALDDLPAEFARAQCELVERCYGPLYHVFFVFEDCETRTEAAFRDGGFAALEAAIDAKTVKYDAEKAARCLDELATRDCSEVNQRTLDACEDALAGTIPLGGECNLDEECEGARICEVAAQCPGTCVERYAAGQACTENDECADGLVCSEATNRCVTPAGDGQACGGGIEPQCDGGLLCAGEDENQGRTGTCHPEDQIEEHGIGEACSPSVGDLCEAGLSCVIDSLAPTFACQAIAASGGPCGIGFPEQCPVGEYCPISAAELAFEVLAATCRPLPEIGEPCAERPIDIGAACEPYARCDLPTGTCLGLRELGESCSSDELCHSNNCEGGGCAPVRACQ
ncbi:MAG TPA: hypothetical protein VFZ53_33920 [Polyangiaceae bacterium]